MNLMNIGDLVTIMDENGKLTDRQGIIIGELTPAQLNACRSASDTLNIRAIWPGGIRVFILFLLSDGEEEEGSRRLDIYCDAYLSPVQPDHSRN